MRLANWKRSTILTLLAAMLSQGCAAPGRSLQYLIQRKDTVTHYRDYATAIEYPVESPEDNPTDPALFNTPRTITTLEDVKQRPVTLDECIREALSNAAIVREDQSFLSPGNPLLANPSRVSSVYDPAIQDTGFLFGNRGMEAALSDFDPIFTNSMQWGRTEDVQNTANVGLSPGDVLVDETAQFQSRLEKQLANSGTVAIEHDWNYSQNNQTRLFPSAYTGFLQAEYRQPLLAASGTEYTRIAGPAAQSVRGVSGVSQGVLISRINSDITLLEFEQSVTNMVRDVENKYWDLYLYLQLYHSEVKTFEDLVVYRDILKTRDETGDTIYQAESRLYEADARLKGSLADVLQAENRLRRLMGLPLNDGEFLMPVDQPSEAKFVPDWNSTLTEALANRPELRRQKWEIRSLELQLTAAKNLNRPRLDFVSQYRVNGFGDNLLGQEDDDNLTDVGYASAYESMTQGINTGWGLGLQFSMPLGLRLARAQVRNYELRLRKARTVLTAQEEEIARELNNSILELDRWYLLAEVGAKRSDAALAFVETAEARVSNLDERGNAEIGRVLEAKISSREADQSYLRSIVEYNKAITEYNFRKGTLLTSNAIVLAEGQWNPAAYEIAKERGQHITNAFDDDHVEAHPGEFVAGPANTGWESLGVADRPHVPGAMEAAAAARGNAGQATIPSDESMPPAVPEVPPMMEEMPESSEPAVPRPQRPQRQPQPQPQPNEDPEKARELLPGEKPEEVPKSIRDAVERDEPKSGWNPFRNAGFMKPSAEKQEDNKSRSGRARMSSTGKPGF
ncbi:MAG: TolC family protein [Planctomycetaceae bacterium]|nr:TolC family protein [Planctomycetaceae bacterium]